MWQPSGRGLGTVWTATGIAPAEGEWRIKKENEAFIAAV
jgi:hypothetical protein